jgi:hypothetical protein
MFRRASAPDVTALTALINVAYQVLSVVDLRTELPPFYRALGYAERTTAPFPHPERATQPCHMIVMSKNLTA